jgi:transcription elongation factor
MQKIYVAKSPINFVQFSFRVNAGDILVHDTVNQKLTVFRNGQIVKTLKQSSLGMSALLKDHAEEVVTKPTPQPIDPAECQRMLKLSLPKLKPDLPKTPSTPQKPTQEEIKQKRKKAQPTEVSTDDPVFRERMGLKDGEDLEDPKVRKRLGLKDKTF